MFVKVVESFNEWQSEDFRLWIRNHSNETFKVIDKRMGNDGKPVLRLAKVPFDISERFCVYEKNIRT